MSSDQRRRMPGGPRSEPARARLRVFGLVIAALFAALFARLYYLQVLNAPAFEREAVDNQVRLVYEPAPRGLVVARHGQLLVGNQTTETVTLSRVEAARNKAVVARVAALLGMTPAEVEAKLTDNQFSPYEPVPIATNVGMPTIIYLEEHQRQFPGVSAQLESERYYPNGTTAAHLLGYLGPITPAELKALAGQGYHPGDIVGQSGVEAAYQAWLRGRPGVTKLEVDAAGQVVGTLGSTPPQPGDTVQLTLDLGLQKAVDRALADQIHRLNGSYDAGAGLYVHADSGAAVVLDPNNGDVLAMASYPTYDPSVWVGGISEANYQALTSPQSAYPLVNRAIQGLYTPGSTFKIATATAALDTGLISPTTLIDDRGYFAIPNCHGQCVFHNAGGEALGYLDITKAIAASDDVFFYTLGYDFYVHQAQYGPTPIQHFAHLYGLGEPTGIALPGEAVGRIDSPAERIYLHDHYPKAFPYDGWYAGDNLELAFGQGETVITPLELAVAYATFANGGTRYAPRVAADVIDPTTGRVVKTFPPVVTGHVPLPPVVRQTMLKGFEDEVSKPYGTGYAPFLGFPLSRFPIAGKTGTASQRTPTGAPANPTALYVGFAPANAPQYVVAVVINHAGYGAVGAAPVARSIFQYLMTHPVGPVVPPKPAVPAASGRAPSPSAAKAPSGTPLVPRAAIGPPLRTAPNGPALASWAPAVVPSRRHFR